MDKWTTTTKKRKTNAMWSHSYVESKKKLNS
jgi:hypothetical protein